jgi:hypothetical protein
MNDTKKCYLVAYMKDPRFIEGDGSRFGTYITNWSPDKDSDSWVICELEVEVEIPTEDVLQGQAVQALQRVRAKEVAKGLETLGEIDAKISTLTAIEQDVA